MKKWIRVIWKAIYLSTMYLAIYIAYMSLQEFYVENCTMRAGIIQMILGLPACNQVLKILQFVGEYFVTILLGLTTISVTAVI
jgi:hypothetical protein